MKIDFKKYADGLAPAIIQDANTGTVLMLGFMNAAALEQTTRSGKVTFYSRSKQRLWTKGETSGNFLRVVDILPDCDHDTILIKATPDGPVCHTGKDTCFGEVNRPSFLQKLEKIIQVRKTADPESSYTASLFRSGRAKVAQKVGEEAVELVIEAMKTGENNFTEEAADLLFHYLVLLADREVQLREVLAVLEKRHSK